MRSARTNAWWRGFAQWYIPDAQNASTNWELSAARHGSALRELRAETVTNARSAASDYAAALGANGIEVIELDDTGAATYGVAKHLGTRLAVAQDSAPEIIAREVEVSLVITLTPNPPTTPPRFHRLRSVVANDRISLVKGSFATTEWGGAT